MTLNIDKAELTTLAQAVETKLAIAMNELVHTDAREYREYVKDMVTRLEQLQKKLAAV
ncbi:MAG TPA: hypothetical protein VIF62_31645 [Labilithrix sp.]|jgi:hypothetical protein